MTTANMSVGLETSAAYESLRKLRADMQAMPHNLLISVDPASIDRDIQRYLKQRTFKISVNTKALGAEIANDVGIALDRAFEKSGRTLSWNQAALRGGMNAAIDGVFNDKQRRLKYDRDRMQAELRASIDDVLGVTHHITINKTLLTAQVREAVATGLAGGVVRVGGVAGAAAAPAAVAAAAHAPDLTGVRSVIRETLAPAVDELSKAALQIASVARKAGVSQAAGGPATAKESISTKDPISGFTTSFSRRLENPELQLGSIQVANQSKALAKQQAEEDARTLATRGALVNQRVIEVGKAEAAVTEALVRSEARIAATRASLVDQRISEVGKAEATGVKALVQAEKRIAETRAALVNQRVTEVGKAEASGIKALAESERAIAATRASLVNQRVTEVGKGEAAAVAAEVKAQSQVVATRAALTNQRVSEIGKIEKQGLEAQKAALVAYYEKAKFEAGKQFTGQGPSIVAAQQTSAKFGTQATTDFLGPKKGFLLDASNEIENYRRKVEGIVPAVKASGDAHKVLTGVMNESHSAARGLAGSMGALWTTYGSIVPLVAAAAIGASLRNVFTVGKDVEYQLAFVSALSDGAVVANDKFNQSLKGTMIAPTQAAEAMRGLAQNGLTVKESLQELPQVLTLATAGEMSLMQAALGATGVMAAFNLTVNDIGHVSDVFTKAAAISNTSVQGMVESMKQASVVGDEYHITLEQTAASLAILAQRNIIGTSAGTSLRNMIQELYAPTKKARDALDSLKIVLTDDNKQFVGYEEALKRIRNATLLLNEPSRAAFLEDVFNKKGDKAISALVNDFDQFGSKLDEIKNKSAGFSQGVTDALGETTQGKIKKLFSEFELSANTAFTSASESAGSFIDTLRIGVASPEFQATLKNIVDGVVSLTKFLSENAKVIAYTAGAWLAFKVIDGVITSFIALRGAMFAAQIGVTSFGIAAGTALGIATGGLSLVAALVAEYFLLKNNTDSATDALKAHTSATELANSESDARIKKMMGENDILVRQNELMWQGVDAVKAKRQAEGEVVTRADLKTGTTLAQNEAALADKRSRLINQQIEDQTNAAAGNFDTSAASELQKDITNLEKAVAAGRTALANSAALKRETDVRTAASKGISLITDIDRFNADLVQRKSLKASITIDTIDIDWAKAMPEDVVRAELQKRTSLLNKDQLNTYTHKSNDRVPRALDKADVADAIQDIHAEEDALKAYAKFRKELDDAKYNSNLFGPYVAAQLTEQRAALDTAKALELQVSVVQRLKDLKDRPTFDDVDRKKIDTVIKREEDKIRTLATELEYQKQIAAVKADVRAREDNDKFGKQLSEAGRKAKQSDSELVTSYSVKIVDPGQAAQLKAVQEANKEYGTIIADQQDRVNKGRDSEALLLQQRAELLKNSMHFDEDAVAALDIAIAGNEAQLATDKARLAIAQAMASSQAQVSGNLAARLYADSQTAEYGWNKFWEQYRSQAESSAKIVEDVMKNTTSKMSDSLATFVTTGKLDFKSLVNSIIADAVRAQSNKWVSQLLGFATTAISAYAGAGASTGTGSATGGSFNGAGIGGSGSSNAFAGFAKGGVMTPWGELPLRRYAAGGIEHGPAVSVHGEGTLPEANVPLQDGRTIPVTISGNQAPVVNMPVTVINRTGTPAKARTERDGNGGIRVILDAVRSQLGSEIDNGGGLGSNIQGRFGLNNAAGLMR